ncbi:hypothetical protein SEUCBS140593_009826 [Sporothrix eucalyptigena]|uniref:Uncharacterized protein n=1 Tax=Sporothrix eucalyptigena TaxID=1812306 RepID=A0ABP0CZ24_9PEZI
MASFSRGLMGFAHHGFAASMLRLPHASLSSTGSSPVLSALRIRLSRPQAPSHVQFFSSSMPARGKGPRGKAIKKVPNVQTTNTSRTPSKPRPIASPSQAPATAAPKAPVKPRAAPVATSAPRSVSAAVAAATASSTAASVSGFAEQLGRRTVGTLLYQAPSHFWFRATTLVAGFLTIAYTLANYWQVFVKPPEGLLWWVPHLFAVICGVMIAGGTYFLMGGFGIVRVIQAIPSARIEAISGKAAAATAARAVKDAGLAAAPPVFLEIEIGRVLPILPARKRYVLPENLVVPFRFASYGLSGDMAPVAGVAGAGAVGAAASGAASGNSVPVTGYERVKAHEAEQKRLAENREYEMNHLMTAPFRHAGQGAQSAWSQIQRAFSREGFVSVLVNGDRQKLDVTGGWALENGRALDRLITLKSDIK